MEGKISVIHWNGEGGGKTTAGLLQSQGEFGDWICRKEGRSSVSPLASLARVESLYFLQILNSEMVLMLLECVHVEQQRSREY